MEMVLASGSPRRFELLSQLGFELHVLRPDIDETPLAGEAPGDYVTRMSQSKFSRAMSMDRPSGLLVLCADTIVEHEGKIYGKPVNKTDCVETLMSMSGSEHRVITSVSMGFEIGQKVDFSVETLVKFRTLNVKECERYWDSGEPRDKAGSYGMQGLGAVFVERINGSASNVIGLPLTETAKGLRDFGIPILGIPD